MRWRPGPPSAVRHRGPRRWSCFRGVRHPRWRAHAPAGCPSVRRVTAGICVRMTPTGCPVHQATRPWGRRRIAYTVLLRQGQGNAALLQVCVAATPGQGRLEGGEVLCQVRTRRSRRMRCWGICGERPGCCHWRHGKPRWRLSMAWHTLPVGLEASARPPGAAAPHATAHAPFPYSPRHHKQSRRSGHCAPACAGCAGGRNRGRGTG